MSKSSGPFLPPDGGWGWMIVIGVFMTHFIFDGIFYSLGILFPEFIDYFHTSQSETSLINSLAMGIPFLIGPFASILNNKFGSRIVAIIGSLILASGFIVTYFTPNLHFMYFSLGILPGLGYGIIYLPSIVILNQYFEKRRAFAVGISVSGAGIGNFAFSPIIKALTDSYGWKGTMLVLSGVTLNCVVCGALFRPLTKLRMNKNPTTLSGTSANNDYVAAGIVKPTPDSACHNHTSFTFRKGRKDTSSQSKETSFGTTIDDAHKVYTISMGNNNTFSRQNHHIACTQKGGTPVDLFDGYSETIPMDDLKKSYNISLGCCNMFASRHKFVVEHKANQHDAEKKEINNGLYKFTCILNHSQDEYIHTLGAAGMLQPDKVLPDSTVRESRDQSNRNHSNENQQNPYNSSNILYRTAFDQDSKHSLSEDNSDQTLPQQIYKWNQTFDEEKQKNDNELDYRAIRSVSEIHDEDTSVKCVSGSRLDNIEAESKNHEEPLVVCKCITLSAKHAEELRTAFQLSLMKNYKFVIFLASHLFYAFGYYIPYVFLPVYAESIGIDIDLAAWVLSTLGISSTVSRVISGFLSDLTNVNRLYLYSASLLICGVATALVPLCLSFPLLMAYACILGVFSGVTLTLISVLLVDLVGIDLLSEAFGIINLVEGVTALSGAPLAGWLFDQTRSYTISFIMTGVAITVSGLTLLIIPCVQKREKQREE